MTYIEEARSKFNYEPLTEEEAAEASSLMHAIADNVETVIIGKREQVELAVACMTAGGHALIEDLPGVGKTSLATALSKSVNCEFRRIQFTPDVMPSDISGFSIYNQKTGEFEFRRGAAAGNIILADELNRASAKTQSALLEIMEERQVTVDSQTYYMEPPYMVLATQNPIDLMGTYALPEAQIDRFMLKFEIGYPGFANEINILMRGEEGKKNIKPVTDGAGVRALMEKAGRVVHTELMASYIVGIVEATRSNSDIRYGASPRGSISLYRLSRAFALLRGRNYVLPEDIRYLAPYVLGHRIILSQSAVAASRKPREVIGDVIRDIVLPSSPEGI